MIFNRIKRDSVSGDVNDRINEAYTKVLVNEASQMTVDEFVKALEAEVKKSFPKSYISVRASTNLGASIMFQFALGKDKSQWTNGIIQNDPLFSSWMIGWNSFTEGHFIKDKIEAELSTGGSLKVNPDPGSHMALGSVKIGWRKKTDTPEKIVKYFGNYFKKVQTTLKANKDRMTDRDMALLKNKF